MMKKFYFLFLLGLFFQKGSLMASPNDTFTAATVEGVEITYTILSEEEKTVQVGKPRQEGSTIMGPYAVGYGTSGSITIPETVNGYQVVCIGFQAFYYCREITSVTMPESVVKIEDNAFVGCGITSVDIPEKVEKIGNGAFMGCALTSVYIPKNVKELTKDTKDGNYTSLGTQPFLGCSELMSIVVDQDNPVYDSRDNCNAIILTAENMLITGCNSSVIPNTVTYIRHEAFNSCYKMESLFIPKSVTEIDGDAFQYCFGLTSIEVEEGNPTYASPDGCNAIMYRKHLKLGCQNTVIPTGTTKVGYMSFKGCINLKSIDIPEGVDVIDGYAFERCEGLTSVTLPEGLTRIEYDAFNTCVSLEKIILPNSLGHLGSYAFAHCESLKEIVIPNGLPELDNGTFEDCKSLSSVTIGSGVTSIKNRVFKNCEALVTVKSFIKDPFAIDKGVFDCRDGGDPDIIFTQATLYVPFGTKTLYENTEGWKEFKNIVEMEESSEGEESVALDPYVIWCEDNTTLYFLGNGDDISNSSYKGHAITQMWHGETVTKMPENSESYAYSPAPWALNYIFPQCTSVVIDESFKNVRVTSTSGWFSGCHMQTIEGIEYLNTSEVTSMSYMFGCPNLTSLDVSHFDTRKVKYMQDLFGGCNKLETIDLSNFDTSNVVDMTMMFRACSALKTLDLSNFNTSKVTNMTMMFSKCDALTNIDLSSFNTSNVTTMNYMFQSCSSLTSLDLTKFNTEKVTEMYGMFYDCSSLTTIDLSHFDTSNVTAMTMMFAGCSGLTSLDVSKFNTSKVTGMGGMFARCTNLTSLDLRSFNTENVTEMDGMLSESSSLTTLDLSSFNTEKLTTMHAMFNDCSNLKTIYVGSKWSMASIIYEYNFEIFLNCTNLVGEQGTTYREDRIDITYAHVDGGSSNPGYFTFKEGGESPAEETEETIKITSAGQTTWCSAYDLDFTNVSGLKAYIAAGYNRTTGTIWLMRVFEVPAKEGILLMGDPGEYKVPHKSTTTYYMNMFKGTLEDITINETEGEYTNYYLSNGDSGVGFYKVNGSIGIKAHRAYLPLLKGTAQAGTRFIGIEFGDGTTNLTPALSKGEGEGEWYTLQGQRVTKPGKGLYIRNGKKVVIK